MGRSEVTIIILIMVHLTSAGPSLLILGGENSNHNRMDSVELVSLVPGVSAFVSKTCNAVPNLPLVMSDHSTTIINNNRLLSCGGISSDGGCWTTSEGAWSEAPQLPKPVVYGQLVSVDGSAFFLGGLTESGVTSEIYTIGGDVAEGDTWQGAGELLQGRWGHCTVVVDRNNIITTGGVDGDTSTSVELFHSDDGTSSQLKSLKNARWHHGCTTYNTHPEERIEIIVAGGVGRGLRSVEKMSLARTSSQGVWQYTGWTEIGGLPAGRWSFPMVNVDNQLYIVGGEPEDGEHTTRSILVSKNAGKNWKPFEGTDLNMQTGRYGHTAVSSGDIC